MTLTEGIVCVWNLVIIAISIYLCHRLLTSAVLTQSMNDMMNYLLLLPAVGCAVIAYYIWLVTIQ